MGVMSDLECSQCGLQAKLMQGGGFYAFTDTVWCGACRLLQSVVKSHLEGHGGDSCILCNEAAKNRNAGGVPEEKVWHDSVLKCSDCDSEKVQKWNLKDPCPSCGGAVENLGMGMWD